MIGFVGLSHLGIVSSLVAASKGQNVIAFDTDGTLCRNLDNGKFPMVEPGLDELGSMCGSRIRFTDDPKMLSECSVIYLSLDVDTDENDRVDLAPLTELIDHIYCWISSSVDLVIMSQVPVGFTRRLATELNGRSPQNNLKIFYQVETLVIGDAIARARSPEMLILGQENAEEELPQLLSSYLKSFDCTLVTMGYESAELAKAAINSYLMSSVAMANTFAEVCEKVGADWSEITPALRLDKRIGQRAYIEAGLGLSGGHLERDLRTMLDIAEALGVHSNVIKSWDSSSKHRRGWVANIINSEFNPSDPCPMISIWGLAYKPDTDSTKNSVAIELINNLHENAISVYDPVARLNDDTREGVTQESSYLEACKSAGILVIASAWKEFKSVDLEEVKNLMAGRVIIDPLGVLDGRHCSAHGFNYYRLGRKPLVPNASDVRY